jgi:tungstate transport system substrate-binding protein
MTLLLTVLSLALSQAPSTVVLATTTSTYDTGLLDSLLPIFERASGFKVRVISVGSGQALELGRRGDADVVLSHAPRQERELLAAGYFTSRRRLMHNDFMIVGPKNDPAHVRDGRDAVAAMRTIARENAPFVSRGDRSGTHQLELELWRRAGITPARSGGYVEAGQGMGATLQIASERQAYALTDRGTFLAWKPRLDLIAMVRGDSLLLNVYHVLEVALPPQRPNRAGAKALADFFFSSEARNLIANFGRGRFGEPLFVPDP